MKNGVHTVDNLCLECSAPARGTSGLCAKHYAAAWARANKDKINAASNAWKKRNPDRSGPKDPERRRETVMAWKSANQDKMRAINRASHLRNKVKRNADAADYRSKNIERMRSLNREWSKANPEKSRVTKAARRAAQYQATPAWARGELESLVIREMYALAVHRTRSTGIEWHVDHSVPLKSRRVCGLHCVSNLSVMSGSDNHKKGNRYWPDM